MNNRSKGIQGETDAEAYLTGNGYRIRARNYSCTYGEIDLIAEKDGRIIFVEVKSRTGLTRGTPAEAVNRGKQQRILRAAVAYCKDVLGTTDVPMRFDVIEILPGRIRHIPSAFTGSGYY